MNADPFFDPEKEHERLYEAALDYMSQDIGLRSRSWRTSQQMILIAHGFWLIWHGDFCSKNNISRLKRNICSRGILENLSKPTRSIDLYSVFSVASYESRGKRNAGYVLPIQ
jgi:hypothetical protein